MKRISGKVSITGIILMAAGGFIVCYLLYGNLLAMQVENKVRMESKVESESGRDAAVDAETLDSTDTTDINDDTYPYLHYSNNLPQPEVVSTTTKALEPSSWKGDADNPKVFARMTIPKIDLVVPVVEGVEKADIKLAVGHVPDTAAPGETGNSAYAGHRSHTYGKFFHRLGEVELGDEIIVETKEYKFKYIVTEIFEVNPDEVWVLDDIPEKSVITLITCAPLYGNKYRLIVRGTLEGT
ncbi:MAG: class D sortase [Clostridiaceae bacterium]